MKSGKQQRQEIKAKRRKKAEALVAVDTCSDISDMPPIGAIQADHEQLEHIDTYGFLPNFYVDKRFVCRDCGAREIWIARQQKWWYEVAKGHIDSTAGVAETSSKTRRPGKNNTWSRWLESSLVAVDPRNKRRRRAPFLFRMP